MDDAVVIGAGHAGLAASHALAARAIDHVVLERGEVGRSWRDERWDSLRLLTPNWLNGLPGQPYAGDDPDGYMTAGELVACLERYAAGAPVREHTPVTSLRRTEGGYLVNGALEARTVVIASGACNVACPPAFAADVPVAQLTSLTYRNPEQVEDGGVLVVGASASGVQIAAELQRAGRQVTLAVGEHVRMPRTYRGRDVLWWMHATGVWDQTRDELDDIERARRLPSPQLVGSPQTLDLNALQAEGVELVGRWSALRDGTALFSGGLRNVLALADLKLNRLLDGFDAWDGGSGERPEPTRAPESPRWRLDLTSGEIGTVVWATGLRPDYSWLDVDVLDRKGRLRHDGGVVDSPGLFVLGLPVLRRRRSTFLSGIEDDARAVVAALAGHLDRSAQPLP